MRFSGNVLCTLFLFAAGTSLSACLPSAPICQSKPQLWACNEPVKQINLQQLALAELGRAKHKNRQEIDISLAGLQPGQTFVCKVAGQGNEASRLEKIVSLVITPLSLGCMGTENGAVLSTRCHFSSGESKATAEIGLANEWAESVAAGLLCLPEPLVKSTQTAAAQGPEPGVDPGSNKRTPPVADSTVQKKRPAPSRQEVRVVHRETRELVPSLSLGTEHKDTHEPLHSTLVLGGTPPAIVVSPPVQPPPVQPPPVQPPHEEAAPASFRIDVVGELPRLVITLLDCDDPHFQAGSGGSYSIGASGSKGRFQIEDVQQCQIKLVNGVKSDQEVKKIKGSIALRW